MDLRSQLGIRRLSDDQIATHLGLVVPGDEACEPKISGTVGLDAAQRVQPAGKSTIGLAVAVIVTGRPTQGRHDLNHRPFALHLRSSFQSRCRGR